MNPFVNEKFRAAIYALVAAIFGVLTVIGIVNDQLTASALTLTTALSNVLALVNVPWVKERVATRKEQ